MKKVLIIVSLSCLFFSIKNEVYGKEILWYRQSIQIPTEIATATTIDEIKPFLESPDEKVRIAAVRRLGQIGDKNAVKLLVERFWKEPYENVREIGAYVKLEIIDALEKIGGEKAKYALFKVLATYLRKGPQIREEQSFYWDGDYASIVRTTSQSLYKLYDPKEDKEIYDFFKPIALNEIKDKFILQNSNLRKVAYKIYFKTEIFQKGIPEEEIPKYIKESIPPYTGDEGDGYESPGILSQKSIERSAKEELLREYSGQDIKPRIIYPPSIKEQDYK